MKPARSLMDLYRTETYHKINIKYKIKTNSSNAFSMCVRSTLGKLLRHQTPNKLLDRVIQARRRSYSQKLDRGDRSEQLQVMMEMTEDSVVAEGMGQPKYF